MESVTGETPAAAAPAAATPTLFLRNATGLVKGWSGFDAFVYSFMSVNLVTLGMYYSFSVFGWVTNGSPIAAILVTAVAMTFLCITYAGLIAVMPRAGGDYVWQSRILDGPPGAVAGAVTIGIGAGLVAGALGLTGVAQIVAIQAVVSGNMPPAFRVNIYHNSGNLDNLRTLHEGDVFTRVFPAAEVLVQAYPVPGDNGNFPPGAYNYPAAIAVVQNLADANAAAYTAVHQNDHRARVGFVQNMIGWTPNNPNNANDVEGARAASALSVSVLTGGCTREELEEAGTDVVLESLEEFPAWLDEHLLTSDPHISAIGDCARHPSAFSGSCIRIESVQNAMDQARTVAARLLGKAAAYDAVPWFWSDQGDLNRAATLRGRHERHEPRFDEIDVLRHRARVPQHRAALQHERLQLLHQPCEHRAIRGGQLSQETVLRSSRHHVRHRSECKNRSIQTQPWICVCPDSTAKVDS